ncbi:MAG: RNA polymerase sigma factor RpoH [Gammaproteobacteria bacterium]|nr:RNA polymerase sigma factor RpoH [Gammaproteobacteria bacterium]
MNRSLVMSDKNISGLVPLGDLDAYIAMVNKIPMLTEDEEHRYLALLYQNNDLEAAQKLILSHLRLVVSISRKYLGYGLPQGDLIQEGNVGLMKAVRHFDPSKGLRLSTYAIHWIKSTIHEFVIRNWKIVRVATTKAQRKLFFGLRELKQKLKLRDQQLDMDSVSTKYLSEEQIEIVSKELNVSREDVIEMETRMGGVDESFDANLDEDNQDSPIHYLSDATTDPMNMLYAKAKELVLNEGLEKALDALDSRSREIIVERWFKVDDNGHGGMTLQELATKFGISAERVRQLETNAMKKMRLYLEKVPEYNLG